jgi:ketosteroid isomerase-like protein
VTAAADQLKTIAAMFDAFARFDGDAFVTHLTEDVDFRPSGFMTGRGEFHGREAVREDIARVKEQLEGSGERVLLRPLALYVDRDQEEKILALARLTIIRPTSESFDTDMAFLHTMEGDKVAELRTWLDHEEGLSQLSSPEEVPFPR